MTGSETVEVAYGEGWDSGRAAVLGPIDAAVAAARDAGGLPYAVMLRQQGSPGVVVAHVAWERHYLGSRSSTTRPPIGRDADGEVACFVADMLILHEATLTRPARSAGR